MYDIARILIIFFEPTDTRYCGFKNTDEIKTTLINLESPHGDYGEHYHLAKITDTINLGCQMKYIFKVENVKKCPSFDS